MSIANTTFSNYIVGQLLEACVVAVMATIALFIIGIDSAVMIGIIAGITNLIPYIGPWIGTALAAVMALLSGEPIKVIWVVIGMQIVQQIDNNLDGTPGGGKQGRPSCRVHHAGNSDRREHQRPCRHADCRTGGCNA